jgi:hypothetical protein
MPAQAWIGVFSAIVSYQRSTDTSSEELLVVRRSGTTEQAFRGTEPRGYTQRIIIKTEIEWRGYFVIKVEQSHLLETVPSANLAIYRSNLMEESFRIHIVYLFGYHLPTVV